MAPIFPFRQRTRLIALLAAAGAAGWHLDRWQERRFEPKVISYEYASDDPALLVLARLALGPLDEGARSAAAEPLADGGWRQGGQIVPVPEAVALIGEDAGYQGRAGATGLPIALPAPGNFGQAVDAMRRSAYAGHCLFAIADATAAPRETDTAPATVMEIVWTRSEPDREFRLCKSAPV